MTWCKADVSNFFGSIFFFLQVTEFLHVAFNVIEKQGPVSLPLIFALYYKDAAR